MNVRLADRLGALLSLFLVTALSVSAWLLATLAQQGGLLRTERPQGPTAIVGSAIVTKSNALGEPAQKLVSPKMVQMRDGSMEVDAPHIFAFREDRPPVTVRSIRGTVSPDQSEVVLQGDVVVFREAFGKEPAVTVKTSVMNVYPNEHVAKTQAPVMITRGESTLTGLGMHMDQNTDRITILADSRLVVPRATSNSSPTPRTP